ncbi:MAG: ribonucleotide reductase N-terminal alpha domain-containing protein, partial [Acidiferrobacterales bacterium]
MKTAQLQADIRPSVFPEIPLQAASLDIWDKKYRLKTMAGEPIDQDLGDTFKRVARALAAVESAPEKQEQWFERFLWALHHGAIPAGRVISNAGALEHKPATSTINCTVSRTIPDSMDGILRAVHEAGLTLKAGCGIGYEFSTLRPKGAFVSGAGAYTSGPLSFMDIFDAMCFTVMSAGGRRGAQMGTFDISHPDVLNFIRAKREDGRLRQFNLSCLITDEFMQAVRTDAPWDLLYPANRVEYDDPDSRIVWRHWPHKEGYIKNDLGQVACRVYRTIPAQRLWNLIMASTYDYAEPGFILIDRINEMNNNWFCENIRATNPCITGDTWIHTAQGAHQVRDLIGRPFQARVNGADHVSGPDGFFHTGTKPVVRLRTAEGYSLRLTSDHRVRRVTRFTRYSTETEW